MKSLFDTFDRTYLGPSSHNENHFNFYNRSGKEDVSALRELLNKWYLNYPENERNELKKRFKKTFSSAFFELFIHELFKCQGFEIIVHPELLNSTKRPDFLIKKNNLEVYVEAKEARDKTKEEEALENKINHFYDSLNTIKSPKFFLCINELIIKSTKQPQTKNIIKFIESQLDLINPDDVTKRFKESGFEEKSNISYDTEEVKVVFSLIPKSPMAQDHDDLRPNGMYPMQTFWGGSEESIKDSFIKKAKKYGKLDKPYIIVINAIGIKGDVAYDIENAIWGSFVLAWSTDPSNQNNRLQRKNNGLFYNEKGPQFKNVSGVFVTKVMRFNIHVAPFWFVKHPFTENDIDFNQFDLSHLFVKGGIITEVKKLNVAEILNIKDNFIESKYI